MAINVTYYRCSTSYTCIGLGTGLDNDLDIAFGLEIDRIIFGINLGIEIIVV